MLPEELVKKVRLIEISTRRAVEDLMSGQYRSHFKGHGVQFSEHRIYVPGDDVRHIDWKVSARTRDPHLKKFDEERELTVFLVVDVSGSKQFGSTAKLKSEVAAEIAGMLAYAAVHTGDKVGLLLFAGRVEKIIPPKKGRQHILRVIREILAFEPKSKGTALKSALEGAQRIMKHSGIVFVLSDFIADDYEVSLRRLARKHDVIAIQVADEKEEAPPELGQWLASDPETGQEVFVDTSSYAFKKWFKEFKQAHDTDRETALKGGRVEALRIRTQEDYADAVVRFFKARSRKRK